MRIKITTVEEINVDIEKLKELEDFNVDDLMKYGKSTTTKSSYSMYRDIDDNCDRSLEKKILSVLWNVEKA